MGMTLAEKLLASHSGKERVVPGELVNVKVDLVMCNDVTAPLAIREFKKLGVEKLFDPSRCLFVPSHFVPAKDIQAASNTDAMRNFAKEQGAVFFELGRAGIEHAILPHQGWVVPGDVVVGADSHTCTYGALAIFATGMGSTDAAVAMATGEIWMKVPSTMKFVYKGDLKPWVGGKDLILTTIGKIGDDGARYKAMEFTGPAVEQLSVEGRLTMSNMTIEAGGKAGMCYVDDKTLEYVKARARRPWKVYEPDPDAEYEAVVEIDCNEIEPTVSTPMRPSNAVPISKVERVKLDQVFIGSCTNARIEDLRLAASVMKGHSVHQDVRCIVIPASQDIYNQALKEGLIEVFSDAGCVVSTSTCGPCLGGYMGVLGKDEVCLSTSNRNFIGRMGHPEAKVYLGNPAVAAASAVAGRIAHPEEVLN